MPKQSSLLQIVIACSITILAVASLTSATTIGTNITTSGTLSVTGASTLVGNTSITGTLGVTGLTTVVNASSTLITNSGQSWLNGNINVNGMATTTASNGNIASEGTLTVATITSPTASTTFSKDIVIVNASSTGYIAASSILSESGAISFGNENLSTSGTLIMSGIASSTSALVASSTLRVFGTTREGTGTFIETFANETALSGPGAPVTNANGINFKQNDGTLWGSLARGWVNAVNGYVNTLTLKKIDTDYLAGVYIQDSAGQDFFSIDSVNGFTLGDDSVDNASSVDFIIESGGSGERFRIDGGTALMASKGSAAFGLTTSLGDYSATAQFLVGSTTEQLRLTYDSEETSYASFTVNSSGDLTLNTTGNNFSSTDTFDVGGMATTTAASGNFTTAGDVGVSSSTPTADLSVGHINPQDTSTIDFGSPCFRMDALVNGATTTIYYKPCVSACPVGANGGWSTSTVSCFD